MRDYTFTFDTATASYTFELDATMDPECEESYRGVQGFGPFSVTVDVYTEDGTEWRADAFYTVPNVERDIDVTAIDGKESFESAKECLEMALAHRAQTNARG